MLSKLFRSTPKWQSIKSQKRIEAIQELQPEREKDVEILTRLAKEDSEPAVRREAVVKLHDFDILMQIQKRDLEAAVREAASARLHELMSGKSPFSPPLEERLQRLQRINSPQVLVALIREAEPAELRLAAIAALTDEMYLQDIALHSTVARLRQAAAERIVTPVLLEELVQASRQKDKTVYRIAKGRLDELHGKERRENERQERAAALCESMESHARSALNPLYAAKTESLRQQWSELAESQSLSTAERFATAYALACQQAAESVANEQREANEAQARHELQEALETLESTLKEYRGQDDFDVPSLSAVRKTQRLRWELASQLHKPSAALIQRYESAMQSMDGLEALLDQWSQDRPVIESMLVSLAENVGTENAISNETVLQMIGHYRETGWPLPRLLDQAAMALGTAQTKEQPTRNEDSAAHQRVLQQYLNDIDASIRAGNSREASRRWQKALEVCRQHHLHHPRMQSLGEQVRELKSWAGFVVQPKKEALLASMQALIGQDIDPDDLADRIKALQDEWKSLGVTDPSVEQPLWEQFKAASDTAYEPCRQHFLAQRELRAKNLKARAALCEQLEQYRDAITDTVDWKNHDAILRTARLEWQQHQPVDRQSSRHVQERFNGVMKALDAKREAHWQQIANRKQQLIDNALQLQSGVDLRAACNQAKQFQLEWKQIGAGSARTDGRQWKEFRAACDAVFNRREEAFAARKEAHDERVQQADSLVKAMEALASGTEKGPSSEMSGLMASFREMELGREGHVLRERAQTAAKRFDAARQEQQRLHAARQARSGIDAWIAVCAAEQALMENALPLQPDIASLPSLWKAALSGRQHVMDVAMESSEKRAVWQEALSSNTQIVWDALIDLELSLGLPSPSFREAERRNRQLVLLQQKGLRAAAAEANRQNLHKVLVTGPVSSGAVQEIAERLQDIALKIS